MAAKTTEVLFKDMPGEITRRLVRQFVAGEEPQMTCYNDGRMMYYVLTSRRVISVYVLAKYTMLEITSILFADVDSIVEGLNDKVTRYDIKTRTETMIVIIEGAAEVALRFGDALYQAHNRSKNLG